jgi:penicillin-binding protein 1A
VIERGTGTAAQIGRPAAGKTGTTNDYTDARFVGYTPDLVASVWMGYLDERHKLLNVHGIPQVSGGSLPAVMWRDFMSRALFGAALTPFTAPDPTSPGQAQLAPPPTAAPQTTVPPTTVPRTTRPPSTTTPASSSTSLNLPSSTVPKSTKPPGPGTESEPPTEPPPGGG